MSSKTWNINSSILIFGFDICNINVNIIWDFIMELGQFHIRASHSLLTGFIHFIMMYVTFDIRICDDHNGELLKI